MDIVQGHKKVSTISKIYTNIRLVGRAATLRCTYGRKRQFYSQRVSLTMLYWLKQQCDFVIHCYFQTGKSVIHVQCEFWKHFNIVLWKLVPNRSTILNWTKNFCETVNVSNRKPLQSTENCCHTSKHWTSMQLLTDQSKTFGNEMCTIFRPAIHHTPCLVKTRHTQWKVDV